MLGDRQPGADIMGKSAMRRLLGIGLALGCLGLSAGGAEAQFSDEVCAQRVSDLCGAVAIGKCFDDPSMWDAIVTDCHGAVQTLIENEREANEQSAAPEIDTGTNTVSAVGQYGFFYGGQLRMGPGMEFAKQASVLKGDQVEVLEDTGVVFDGYKWFKVRTPRGTGYHWGGIFCITGDNAVDGVFDNCQYMNQN